MDREQRRALVERLYSARAARHQAEVDESAAYAALDNFYRAACQRANPMTRPPNDRGQGRKPVKEGEETTSMTIRLTVGQRAKLAKLGGAQWVREQIDKAKVRGK